MWTEGEERAVRLVLTFLCSPWFEVEKERDAFHINKINREINKIGRETCSDRMICAQGGICVFYFIVGPDMGLFFLCMYAALLSTCEKCLFYLEKLLTFGYLKFIFIKLGISLSFQFVFIFPQHVNNTMENYTNGEKNIWRKDD